jgi:hypothetical protein
MASIVLPAPTRDFPPLLLARRAARRVRRTVVDYCNASKLELLNQFESLGDNCEFGSLQKAYGVNTPAMFRWSDTSVAMLAATLGDNLAGGDDIANLELFIGHDGEYLLRHRLYGDSHTFARADRDDPAQVLKREHRRLILLRRKFLEDARAGRRPYVFRSLRPVSLDEAGALNEALRRKGPNRLLWVRPAASPEEIGRVTRGRDGLLIAGIDALAPYDSGMSFSSRHWLPILRRARAAIAADLPIDRLAERLVAPLAA